MEKLRKLQLAELDILEQIIKILEENKLRYFMMGGTLLGAVRHNGFIPWDDDIDIGMPREDYEKFLDIVYNNLKEPYSVDYYKFAENKKEYISNYIPKIQNNNFKIKNNTAIISREISAWIDIFPLDGMPNNKIKRNMHKMHLLYRRLLLKYSEFSKIVNQETKNRPIHETILIYIGKIINFEKILNTYKCLEKLDKVMKKYKYEESKYVVNFMGAYKFKEMFEKTIYDETQDYKFEKFTLKGPKNYDFVLKQLYGDYMKIPKKEDQNKHKSEINN